MPYIYEICVAGKTIEVSKYHSWRWCCKGERRAKLGGTTTTRQEKVNNRIAQQNLRRILNANFQDGDYLVTYDFRPDVSPPTSTEMQKIIKVFLQKLRREYLKAELNLKYVYVKELGPRGGRHLHMVMNKSSIDLLSRCWTWGGIHVDPLNTDGQYTKIAEYFTKYADRTIKTEGQLIGKRWYPSRNLIRPEPKKRVIKANTYYTKYYVPPGYYVEDEYEGETKDGYRYFSYTLHELKGKAVKGNAGSKDIYYDKYKRSKKKKRGLHVRIRDNVESGNEDEDRV